MSIRCAHCKLTHETVADVRACADHHGVKGGSPAPATAPATADSATGWKVGMPCPVPPVRYAILRPGSQDPNDLVFLNVSIGKEGTRWEGFVFLKVQASDEEHPVRNRQAREAYINAIVEQGWKKCLLRYGQKIGKCGHCGRTLTNQESREYGIGPVCRRSQELADFI